MIDDLVDALQLAFRHVEAEINPTGRLARYAKNRIMQA